MKSIRYTYSLPHHPLAETAEKSAGRAVRDRLEQIVRDVAQENDWQVVELATQPDHVHLFFRRTLYCPPMWHGFSKDVSSHDLREAFPLAHTSSSGHAQPFIQRLALSARTRYRSNRKAEQS